MNDVKENLIKKDLQGTIKVSIFLTIFLLAFEIILCFVNKVCIIFVWVLLLPMIHLVKRKIFYKNAEFCYGKILDVTISDEESDVCTSTKIEFMDSYSKKRYETIVYQHWGDYDEEKQDDINKFYEESKKRIGKKVPLFYKKENPNKNIVFMYRLED